MVALISTATLREALIIEKSNIMYLWFLGEKRRIKTIDNNGGKTHD